MKNLSEQNRINTLDTFRFLSILSVMLFHYFSLWIPSMNRPSLYPYGEKFNFFSYGYLGVEFFFMISGFVIAFTLTKTTSFRNFWIKRLIRLFPAMLICSIFNFVVAVILDTNSNFPNSHSFKNLVFSLTFLSPELINEFFSNSLSVNYLNGGYWSLWPEIQFYFVASILFFFDKKHFVRNIFIFTISIWCINYVLVRIFENVHSTNKFHLPIAINTITYYRRFTDVIFNYIFNSFYFVLGICFFNIYSKQTIKITLFYITILLLARFYFYPLNGNSEMIPTLIMLTLILFFLLFSFFPDLFSFLNIRLVSNVGVASYSLYLLHEPLGTIVNNKFGMYFGNLSVLLAIAMIVISVLLALVSYYYAEKPLGVLLKKKLITN